MKLIVWMRGSFTQVMIPVVYATHYWRQALHCARSAAGATDEEERLFEMSEAWMDRAAVEADVTEQAALEAAWERVLRAADQSLLLDLT